MKASEIRAARHRAGLTQEELAEKLGVSGRAISNWEQGRFEPRNKEEELDEVLAPFLRDSQPTGPTNEIETDPPVTLRGASDAELLAEIARRFGR